MNVTDYTFLLNKPDAVNKKQTVALEKIVEEFPFFQSARALRLKGLYNDDSFKYNNALKVTAAYTTDRSVLFDFITSDTFIAIQKGLYDQKLQQLHDIVVTGMEIVVEAPRKPVISRSEQAMLTSLHDAGIPVESGLITDADFIAIAPTEVETPEQKLDLGKPLEFSRAEKHSFQEWLQLSQITPIQRDPLDDVVPEPEAESQPDQKQKNSALIDRFIESNPKIPPVKQTIPNSIFVEPSKSDNTYLMTETLARVYLEQKKYQKAIQAYEILILKYPEKSSFFADRILDIKNLQQNNNTL